MSGRVGRDRFRRDHGYPSHHPSSSSSSSPLPSSSRGSNPPSRSLWVGNLSHHVSESALSDHFVRFGELESVALPQGRSYAFVNFVRESDAIAAMNSLQGFSLTGLPLRIEFAKADKSSAPSRDEKYLQHRDELYPSNRGSGPSKRESRIRHPSPDVFYSDSSRKADNRTDHPSEILWIGFPSFLKVDETILRKAFSPFGEIEKITAFPGRTYAFVQFRSLSSACRAKETLQGKLFGNPRVHICFARSDTSYTGGGKRGVGPNPPSPHLRHNGRAGSSDKFDPAFGNLSGDSGIRPPQFSSMEYRNPETMSFSRKDSSWTSGNGPYEEKRYHEFEPDVNRGRDLQGYCNSPVRDGTGIAQFHESSPQRFHKRSAFADDPHDLPENANIYHGAKKLKIDSFPQDELPEYPLHNLEHGKDIFPRMLSDFPVSDETGRLPYKQLSDGSLNYNRPIDDKHDWRSPRDTFQSPPPFSGAPLEWKVNTPELHQPAAKEWKWEGTIAKGGTPVCRARCFPVGRIMDISLPEFLDCTARTGLEMLAKHYYQAAGSWVVFFVPASDADMGYYNEFMHYLGEKERAAVSKLDERHTLFLVPPSHFSEKVLKVPGKLSISGVVLRLEPTSPSVPVLPPANDAKNTGLMYHSVDASYQKSDSPSRLFHSFSYPSLVKPGIDSPSVQGNISTSAPSLLGYGHTSVSVSDPMENRHDFQPTHRASTLGPSWSSLPPQTAAPSSRDSMSQNFPITQEYHFPVSGKSGPELNICNYRSGYSSMSYSSGSKLPVSEQKLPASIPLLPGGPPPQQHPMSASSLLGPQRQSVSSSSVLTAEEIRLSGMMGNQSENSSKVPPRYTPADDNLVAPDLSASHFRQLQQPLQAEIMQGVPHAAVGGNREVQGMGGGQDEGEGDPQKRLQATLQLAAALLQQIQQGKGT